MKIGGNYLALSSTEAFFGIINSTNTYLTVFLQSRGFTPLDVGFINAINSSIMIFATPFWGMVCDKTRSTRKAVIVCMSIGSLFYALVPASVLILIGPLSLIYFIFPACSFFRSPGYTLHDSFVLRVCNENDLPYGAVRVWASIAYSLASIILSGIVARTGPDFTFFMYGISAIPLLFVMSRLKDPDKAEGKAPSFRDMHFERLFQNFSYVTWLFFAVILWMPINTTIAFMPYLVDSVGGASAQVGIIIGYKSMLEIPILFSMKYIRKKFPLPLLLAFSAFLYTVEALCYVFAGSLWQIVAIVTMGGVGTGLLLGTAPNYVYSLSPRGLYATAQTVNGAMSALSAILAALLGGFLIDFLGVRMFYLAMAIIMASSLIYFCITLYIGKRKFR